MADSKSIEVAIREAIECTHVEIHGDDGVHFEALIVSPAFAGLARVRRHQLVYAALGGRMHEEIHALSMNTLSPEEWAAR
ncbi:MAG TPA: BolA/IbaG family iron-sulfur metabolism protein [Usitatibacteraceae bacterium]|nr:BolA/IbaG family iron-sulfur metabolism protein [Usitatibacteraceae bacterium]